MAFDDLPLDRPSSGQVPPPRPAPPPARSPTRWIVVGALAVVVGALLALWWMSRAQPSMATPAPTAATDVAVGSHRPKRQPIELPSLESSDPFLRDAVSLLSRHPVLARLLATDGLVRGATLAVVEISDGRTPADPLKVLRPSSRLAITPGGRVDPRTYQRWDGATAALASVNPAEAAQLYVNVKPLFDQAYTEMGHPNGNFDDAIARAIGVLKETPGVAVDPELLRRPGYYEHADPTLRSLKPVQKQLMLVGPDNRRRILAWLGQLAAALELK